MKMPRVQDFDPNAKVPELTSPLEGMPTIEKPKAPVPQRLPEPTIQKHHSPVSRPDTPTSQEDRISLPLQQQNPGLPASMQTRKDANLQASKPANLQTRLHANLQAGKHARVEKFSTYLTPACKKGLKRIAFETDRKDYEVLIEAVEQFLKKQT